MSEKIMENGLLIDIIQKIVYELNTFFIKEELPFHLAIVKPTYISNDNNNIYQVAELLAQQLCSEKEWWIFRKLIIVGAFPDNFGIGIYQKI